MRLLVTCILAAIVVSSTAALAQNAQSPLDQQLRGKIGEALSRNDFQKAESLAVTDAHWQMIAEAKERQRRIKAEEQAARNARRPVVCTNNSVNTGWTSSGTTVCR